MSSQKKSKVTVLYISLTENNTPGAREIQVSRVLEAFNKTTDHEMKLVTIRNEFVKNTDAYYVNSIKNNSRIGKILKTINPFTNSLKEAINTIEVIFDSINPDILITSSNPIESHIIGIHFKRTRNIKWIAFFSDPKPVSKLPPPYFSKRFTLAKHYQYRLTKKVFELSDRILMPSKYGVQLSSKIYNIDLSNKANTVPHLGFSKSYSTTSNGFIVHAGKLVQKRSSVNLLNAIKRLKNDNDPNFKGLLCLGIVDRKFKQAFLELGLEDVFFCKDKVSLNQSRKYLSGAKAILIIEADMTISPFLPSKFAEAVSLKKPLLAITPKKSEIRDYLNTIDGVAVSNNEEAIYLGLKKVINKVEIKKSYFFDEKNVAKNYLDIINNTLES